MMNAMQLYVIVEHEAPGPRSCYNCVVLSAKESLSSWMMLCVFTHLEAVAVWPSAEKNWVSEVLAEGKGSLASRWLKMSLSEITNADEMGNEMHSSDKF